MPSTVIPPGDRYYNSAHNNYTITNCVFESVSTANDNGGAILLSNAAQFVITESSFALCSARGTEKRGGAVSFSVNFLNQYRVYYRQCCAFTRDRRIIRRFRKRPKSNASPSLSAVIWTKTNTALSGWTPSQPRSANSLIHRTAKSTLTSSDFVRESLTTLSSATSIFSTLRAPQCYSMLTKVRSPSSTFPILSLSL
jgi:hypothetical protein